MSISPLFVITVTMVSAKLGGEDDQFNLFKMLPVIGKVEGRGNGVKPRTVSCHDVTSALHCPPGYVCKLLGCEIGAKTGNDDSAFIYVVNDAFQQKVLTDICKKFIKMYVLYTSCSLSGTINKLKMNGKTMEAYNARRRNALSNTT